MCCTSQVEIVWKNMGQHKHTSFMSLQSAGHAPPVFAADRFFISSSCSCCWWKWWYCADFDFDDDADDCCKGDDHCSENMQLVKVQWIWLPSWNISQRYKISPDPERTMILIQFLPVWSPEPLLLLRMAARFNARLFFEVFFHVRIWGQF